MRILRKKNLVLLLSAGVFLLSSASFVALQGEDDYSYTRKVYHTACKCSYQYVYEKDTDRLFTISKLYGNTDTLDGISYSIDEHGDTSDISYNNKGKTTPLSIYIDGIRNKKPRYSISEIEDDVAVDDWRRNYAETDVQLNGDSTYISYALKDGARIFSEWYDNGRRISRHVDDQKVYDSLRAAYYSITGKQLFLQGCTSCHTIDKPATGPALRGVFNRHSEVWIRKWIANPGRLLVNNDPEAVTVFRKWNNTMMTCFPYEPVLMDKLIAYLKTL